MVIEVQNSIPPDPIEALSLISFFPRTFGDAKDALNHQNSDDLEAIHVYLKSTGLKRTGELYEMAKAIEDGRSELLNTNFGSSSNVEYGKEIGPQKDKANDLERRPDMGRKRARFSLKPDTSHAPPPMEPSFSIDQLQDPEEYFAAFEKFEKTRKELQRQKGGEDFSQVNLSRNDGHRRTGMSRRRVSYTHHDYSVRLENDVPSSQETSLHEIPLQSNHDTKQETAVPDLEPQDIVGSIAKTENRMNKLFDDLMSSNIGNLNENEALSFLQNRLQIRPIDLGKLCLPDFHGVIKPDFVSLPEKLPKDQNSLVAIHNMQNGIRDETPPKCNKLPVSPPQLIVSPSSHKSPFASIPLLGQYLLKSRQLNDPFSLHDIDLSPSTSPSIEMASPRSEHISKRNESSICSQLGSVSREIAQMVADSENVSTLGSVNPFNDVVNDHSCTLGLGVDSSLPESYNDLQDLDQHINTGKVALHDDEIGPSSDTVIKIHEPNATEIMQVDMVQKEVSSTQQHETMEASVDTDVQLYSLRDIDANIKDAQGKAVSSTSTDVDTELSTMENLESNRSLLDQTNANATEDYSSGRPTKGPDIGPEQQNEVEDAQAKAVSSTSPDVDTEPSTMENLESNQSLLDQTNANATEDHSSGRPTNSPDIGPEQQNEEHLVDEGRKTRRRRREVSRRQSLQDAGTFWESGIRRSKRVRRKPMAYWKGERFLYGRVHSSLPTLIGTKTISGTKKNGECTFTVESYVSDAYKQLVEFAAR